ncbi:MAG TPA: hypothetical protein VJ483_02280 [Holophagaceae bacterium]|nr:hypothetical protein [Holophagaceae bacterium]
MSHPLPDPDPTPLAQRLARHPHRDRQGLPPQPTAERHAAPPIESVPTGAQS